MSAHLPCGAFFVLFPITGLSVALVGGVPLPFGFGLLGVAMTSPLFGECF